MNIGLEQHESNVDISALNGKIFVDPMYEEEEARARINYAVFSSEWDIGEPEEQNTLKIIHRNSNDSITLGFASRNDKIRFANVIYASQKVKQVGPGMNLEVLANQRIKPHPIITNVSIGKIVQRFTDMLKIIKKSVFIVFL